MLLAASCDRFKHTFETENAINFNTVLFSPIADSLAVVTAANVQPVMSFYAPDYLHNGNYKASREVWYTSLLAQNTGVTFNVTLLNTSEIDDTTAISNWNLKVYSTGKTLVADSTFTGEKLKKRDGRWLLWGNRTSCCPPIIYKQRVFLEYFTYNTCPNCPPVEALLENLQQTHPDNLSVMEYHLNDPMVVAGNQDAFVYYNNEDMPVVLFQGQTKIIGNNADNETNFTALVDNLAATDSRIDLQNLDYHITGNILSGTVHLNFNDTGINSNTLKLKCAIIDKVSSQYHNAANQPCRNVVLANATKSLQGVDVSNTVSFNITYSGTLPSDAALLVWVQVTPTPFSNNATVYNALESPIVVKQ